MKAILLALSIILSIPQLNAQSITNKKAAQKDSVSLQRSKKDCDPVLKFGEHTGNCSISKNELSQVKMVSFSCADWTMQSFELTKRSRDPLINLGNKFSVGVLKELSNTKKNEVIYIENVKAKGPDGIIRNLPGMTIKVID